jgi:hypothetical protein
MFFCKKLRPFTFVILRILLQNSIFLSGQRDASFILTSTASINPLYLPFLPTNTWWYPPVHSLSLSFFYLPRPFVSPIPLSLSILAPLPLLLRRRAAAAPPLYWPRPLPTEPSSSSASISSSDESRAAAALEARAERCSVHRSGDHPCSSWCWRATRCEVAGVGVASPARDPLLALPC